MDVMNKDFENDDSEDIDSQTDLSDSDDVDTESNYTDSESQ